jgi:division protein CdvB (Snf7/Vps24/ESCRT-III family)
MNQEMASLVNRFVDKWKKKDKQPTLLSKVKSVVKPPENLKQQISLVIQRIDVQAKTLDIAVKRFESRDVDIFNRVVKAFSERDEARANILATELSEIRKIEKMLIHASLAMQSISMRLNTVSELGDLVTVLTPAKSVLNSIGSEMCSVFPEASQELGSIGNLLSEIVVNSNQSTDVPVNTGRLDPEAEKILKEAELAAEKKIKQQLPEVATEKSIDKLTSVEA